MAKKLIPPKSNMKDGSGIEVKQNRDKLMMDLLAQLTDAEVLVGFPEESGEHDGGMSNAVLGYIHDNGAPERNIPARPFMVPGIESVRRQITAKLKQAGKAVLKQPKKGKKSVIEQALHQVGLIGKLGIQNRINSGISPPLAASTLRSRRARGRMGSVPLIDTGQLRNSINYVIRSRKKRTK
jgi:phage gpG-like protein